MKTYQVFSNKMGCDLLLHYDSNDRLKGIEVLVETIITDEQTRVNVFANAPSTVAQLIQLAQKYKWTLTEIKPDLSFEAFWKAYGNTSGSKIKAEKIWDKMSEGNRNHAINYTKKYKQSLGTTTQAYATTYLNGQYWVK